MPPPTNEFHLPAGSSSLARPQVNAGVGHRESRMAGDELEWRRFNDLFPEDRNRTNDYGG